MMKKILTILFFAVVVFSSCSGNDYPKAEDSFDAAREFIDACLKGQFERANAYMLQDPVNEQQLNKLRKDYMLKTKENKKEYAEASIIINNDETLNDSTHIIYYKNSYDKIARKVKVVRKNDNWLVDFKYTFDGNL